MSGKEREPKSRWPGLKFCRHTDKRQERAKVRKLLDRGDYDRLSEQHHHSAKWKVW